MTGSKHFSQKTLRLIAEELTRGSPGCWQQKWPIDAEEEICTAEYRIF
jgi:hypothetical protein